MSQELLIIALLIIGGFSLILWYLNNKLSNKDENKNETALLEWLKSTQRDLQELQKNLTQTLQQSDKNVTDTLQKSYQELNIRMDNAAKVIGELRDETGKFSEIGRSMKELQDFLNSPKLRGNIGERVLTDLVSQMLPKQTFSTQFRFQSGDIVDFVIKTQAGLIPIDSKFPMENFTKMASAEDPKRTSQQYQKAFTNDVRKHIRDIGSANISRPTKTPPTLPSCISPPKPFITRSPLICPKSTIMLRNIASYRFPRHFLRFFTHHSIKFRGSAYCQRGPSYFAQSYATFKRLLANLAKS